MDVWYTLCRMCTEQRPPLKLPIGLSGSSVEPYGLSGSENEHIYRNLRVLCHCRIERQVQISGFSLHFGGLDERKLTWSLSTVKGLCPEQIQRGIDRKCRNLPTVALWLGMSPAYADDKWIGFPKLRWFLPLDRQHRQFYRPTL